MPNVRYNSEIDKLQIYFEGEWKNYGKTVGFVTHFIYNQGDTCDDLTGGWSSSGYPYADYAVTSGTLSETHMVVKSGGSKQANILGTQKSIDLTNYSTLKMEIIDAGMTSTCCGEFTIGASKSNGTTYKITQRGAQTFSVDISTYNGAFYISLASANESTRTVTVSKIWLEQ